MGDQGLIQDTGLFVGQKLFEFSLTELFESIVNLLQTIKEYRDFASPDEAAWFDYIHQIFQLFGFNTKKVAQRLITLQELGSNGSSRALVCIIGPTEDFHQIVFGLDWESYLFYAAKHHQVDWVILTNGLQFKVLNFAQDEDKQKYFKCELDEIIKQGKTDSFLTLYKIFAVINREKEDQLAIQRVDSGKKNGGKGRVLVKRHYQRREFWTQLLSRSKNKTTLYEKKSPGIESYLGIGAGKAGIHYHYIISEQGARVQLYIDRGDSDWNKRVYDALLKDKPLIEKVFGDSLIWERLEDKRASIIRFPVSQLGLKDKSNWHELHDLMIETMIRFEKAFRPFIHALKSFEY